jgi:hypothetical protein
MNKIINSIKITTLKKLQKKNYIKINSIKFDNKMSKSSQKQRNTKINSINN